MRHRTALITATSVAGVAVAGAAAIAASLGILESSAGSTVGSLSAAVAPQTVDVYLPDATATPTTEPAATATPTAEPTAVTYAVEDAGTATLDIGPDGSVVVVSVITRAGWSWTQQSADDGSLSVEFTDGTTTYELLAVNGPDGITASVDQPIVEVITVPAPNTPAPATAAPAAPATPVATAAPVISGNDDSYDENNTDDDAGESEDQGEHEGGEDEYDD